MQVTDHNLAHSAYIVKNPHLYLWLWILMLTSAAANASTESIRSLFISGLFWGIVYAITLTIGRRAALQENPSPNIKRLSDSIAILGLLIFVLDLLSQGLESALLLMMLLLQATIALNIKTSRNLYFAMATSFCILLYSASLSRDSSFVIYLVVFSMTSIFIMAGMHEENCRNRAIAAVETTKKDSQVPSGTIPLAIVILLMAALFYLFIPRPPAANISSIIGDSGHSYHDSDWLKEAGNNKKQSEKFGADGKEPLKEKFDPTGNHKKSHQEKQMNQHSSRNFYYRGFEDKFDINQTGQSQIPSNSIVLYMQSDRPLYLRGKVFDHFDGRHWQVLDKSNIKLKLDNGHYSFDKHHQYKLVDQIIEVAQTLPNVLVAAPKVVELKFPGTVFAQDPYGAMYAPKQLSKGLTFAASSHIQTTNSRTFSADNPLEQPNNYLQLPDNLAKQLGELAKQITTGATTNMQRAILLESHLRENYEYSLISAFNSQGDTPLEEFLFSTRRGHCEYFASAMAMLLRSQEIPSRLVTGFSATNYNPITGYYEVLALDGHAWVEALIKNYGWVSFEPTPFYSLPEHPTSTVAAESIDEYLQEMTRLAQEVDSDSVSTVLLTVFSEFFTRFKQAAKNIYRTLSSAIKSLLPYITGLFILSLTLYFLRTPIRDVLAKTRLTMLSRDNTNQFVICCYQELEAWFRRRKLGRRTGETVEEFAERLISQHHAQRTAIMEIITTYSDVRYGEQIQDRESVERVYQAFKSLVKW